MRWFELPRPGRNNPCLCGSGRKLKLCCRTFYETAPITDTAAGVFLSHELLWYGAHVTYDAISQRLGRLPGPWLLRVLSMLQWLFRDELRTRNYAQQLAFLQSFADPVLARKAEAWLATARAHQAFHRCTIPAMMQVRLLADEGPILEASDAAIAEVATLAIMVNDLLESDYHSRNPGAITGEGVYPVLGASFFRNGFYSHRAHWGAATARNWALLTIGGTNVRRRYPLEWFDLSANYEALAGVTPVDLLAVATGIIAYYAAFTRDDFNAHPERFLIGEHFFDALGNADLIVKGQRVLALLSASWEGHVSVMKATASGPRQNVQQLFSIYNAPFMRDGDVYFPLDFEFLCAQTTEGWYWALVRLLLEGGRPGDVRRMHASYGKAFEWYCVDLVGRCRTDDSRISVWCAWEDEISGPEGQALPDIIVREGRTLFVVEVTSSAVRPAAAISCDADVLSRELGTLWFGESPKLRQLAMACDGVRARRVRGPGLDVDDHDEVVPLFVSLRYVPLHRGTWHWYRDIMRRNGLAENFIASLRILDAEDWEEFCSCGLHGGSVVDAFRQWCASDWRSMSFEDWRAGTMGSRPIHPRVQEHVDGYWAAISDELGLQRPA